MLLVVDVGGSHGIVAIELARAFPGLQLVVQDLHEHIITDADVQKPTDIAGRVRFMVHDFLTTQPVPAAVYFFRMIFHNWPDKYCVKILRALVPVLQPGARVVVNDAVIAEPCTLPWDQETRLRNSDLNMLELQNAGESATRPLPSCVACPWPRLILKRRGPRARRVGGHIPTGG